MCVRECLREKELNEWLKRDSQGGGGFGGCHGDMKEEMCEVKRAA